MAAPARPAPPPVTGPGPGFLGRILKAAPVWALTTAQRELRLSLVRALLGQAGADPDALAAASSLLALSFQEDPFAPEPLALLAALQRPRACLPPRAAALVRLLAKLPAPPDDVRFEEIRAGGDPSLTARYLEVAALDRRHGLSRLAPAFADLCRLPDPDQAKRLLAAFAPHLPPMLYARLRAELACLRASPETALDLVEGLDPEVWGLYRAIAASHLRERLGDREGALAACQTARRVLPHHVNLTLRAHALAFPPPAAADPDPDAAAVCLYSMNKAELFRECLTHLATTRLGGSLVVALDNGATDHTAAMLDEVAGLFPAGRFVSLRLPVNVGAPGARNWLLALPEVKSRPYVAFLDDDAFPPPHWLAGLLATARAHPEAGAVGCAIVDRLAPGDHQSADYNLFPPDMGRSSLPEIVERLFVCDACRGLPDYGLFRYARPCLSVSGCCHLLSRTALDAAGPFDIRFNPTQFDDLERDIRSWQAGYPACYDGTLRVAHHQSTSLAKASTPAQVAQVMGNKIKLETMLTDAAVERLWRENLELLGRDLLARDADLRRLAGTP